MRKWLPVLFVLSLLGCIWISSTTATPQKLARAKTITSSILPNGKSNGFSSKVNRTGDSRRLKTLRNKKGLIESYFAAVDKSAMSLLSQPPVANMTHDNWKKEIERDSTKDQPFQGYSAQLWRGARRAPWLLLHRNVCCDRDTPITPAIPSLWIRKPARDLEFDWFIRTGNLERDRKIRNIVIREAKRF